MTKTRATVAIWSGVLEDDRLHGVRDVLAPVDRSLELVDQVLPLEDVHRVVLTREELGDGLSVDAVSLVLQPVDLHPERLEPREPMETAHRLVDLARGPGEHVRLLAHLVERLLDAV